MEPFFRNIPDYGDHMTIQEFKGIVESGGIIDDDGHGYLATEELMSEIRLQSVDDVFETDEKKWSHVVWFNK